MNQAAVDFAPPTSLRWCVAVTKRSEERLAKDCLERLARQQPAVREVYLPMVLGHPRSRNPIQPMFPRHVFVRIDLGSNGWNGIFTTRGVQSVLRAGDRPGWVEDGRIETLRAEEEGGYVQLRDEPLPNWPPVDVTPGKPWEPGDRVTVEGLPWEAVFNRHLDGNRCELLFSVIGIDSKPAKAVRNIADLRRAPST